MNDIGMIFVYMYYEGNVVFGYGWRYMDYVEGMYIVVV